MLVAQIQSIPLPRLQFDKLVDGVHEMDVVVNLDQARQTGDPTGFIKHEVARHLAGCIHHINLPLGFGCWNVRFTEAAQRMFNLPEGFTA